MTDEYKPEYIYLGIGANGVYARAPNPWGSDPASVTIYDKRLSAYYGDLAEGGIVVDKRPCVERDDFAKWVISGPMLKWDLPPQTCRVVFEGDKPCTDAKECKSLDYISLDLYLGLWRELGAKIGKRVGDTIVWESGEVTQIPPASERWKVTS